MKLVKQAAECSNGSAMASMAYWLQHGIGTKRDIDGACELLERAMQTTNDTVLKAKMAKLLLPEDIGAQCDPSRGAELREGTH